MKFTKQQFKSIFSMVGAMFLTVGFGVGHLIAKNEKVDITPVITVPVSSPYKTLSPEDLDIQSNGSLELHYYFNTTYEWNSNTYDLQTNLYFSVVNGNLVMSAIHEYHGLLTGDALTWEGEQTITNYSNYTQDITLKLYYSMDLAMVNRPHNFQIGILSYVQNNAFNLMCNNYYAYDSLTGYIPQTYYVDDYISADMFQFAFVVFPTLPNTFKNEGVNYVLTHLDEYNLYTENEYLAYGQQQYELGRSSASNVLSVSAMIREIFRAPVSMFQNAFNFVLPLPDGTSLNVGGILTFFLTIGIALTIVSLISKIGGK